LVVVGNTNVGKSTLLNDIMGCYLLNTSERRETTFHWHIRYPIPESLPPNEDPKLYTLQTLAPENNQEAAAGGS